MSNKQFLLQINNLLMRKHIYFQVSFWDERL